jgi:hypothetical protein
MDSLIPMALQEILPALKARYGEVYCIPGRKDVHLPENWFILRSFTLGEFETYQVQVTLDEDVANEELLRRCLIWPRGFDVDDLLMADMNALINKLREVSPYDNPQRFMDKLQSYRERRSSLVDALYIHIHAAFPGMKMAQIRNLSCDEVLHHLAIAEAILGRDLEIKGPGIQSVSADKRDAAREKAERYRRMRELRNQRMANMGINVPEDQVEPETGAPGLSLLDDADDIGKAMRGD